MTELTKDQIELRARARALAADKVQPRAAEVDRSEQYPWETVTDLVEAGFMGMTIPAEWGGQGRSFLDAVLVIEEMAKVCGVTARIVVEANMGAISAVMRYGTDKQRKLAAGLVLAGDKPAICITEPDAGSAASEMTTRAERKGDRWIINGKKHWITGGGVSKLHMIFARVFEDGEEKGIGAFLAVRGDADGLEIGRREPAMGLRGIPECEVLFNDLEVPDEMALLQADDLRRGFARLMTAYNSQRVGAATVAMGIAEGAYELALDYAKQREQFGRPIAEFQGLQWMLADMSIGLAASQALVYNAARSAETSDTGFPDMLMAAQAKVHASETAIEATSDALQVFGAMGYSRNLPLERMYRDARMFTIGGGTAQVLRNLVASRILDMKVPQTRGGYARLAAKKQTKAAE